MYLQSSIHIWRIYCSKTFNKPLTAWVNWHYLAIVRGIVTLHWCSSLAIHPHPFRLQPVSCVKQQHKVYSVQFYLNSCHTHGKNGTQTLDNSKGLFIFLCFMTRRLTQRQHKHNHTPFISHRSLLCDSLLAVFHWNTQQLLVNCSQVHIHPLHWFQDSDPTAAWPRLSVL